MTDTMDIAIEDAELLESLENMEGLSEGGGSKSQREEEGASAADGSALPPSAEHSTTMQPEEESTEVPKAAKRPPLQMGRKKAILATLATPVAQDAAPTKAGEPAEEGDTQDLAPKAPAKKAAKPAPPAIDQDLLQAIVGAAGEVQASGNSKASKNSSSKEAAAKPVIGKLKAGKENSKPTAGEKAKDTAVKQARKKSDKPRNKSGYLMFCAAQRPILKGEKPDLSMTDVTKELAALWKAKTEDEKKVFQDDADAANALQQKEYAANGPNDKKARSTPGAKGMAKSAAARKQSIKAKKEDKREDSNDDMEAAAKSEESDSDSDRENCDWEQHPAEAIVAATDHHKYIVKRKGLDLTEFGLVDSRAVKRQRLEPDTKTPISLEQLEEFEAWESAFKKSVSDNLDRGALEMDNLGKDSPLETCYYLTKMLETAYPLAKVKKGDRKAHFPAMGLSMISQRLLNLEKAKVRAAEAKILSLEQKLAEQEK